MSASAPAAGPRLGDWCLEAPLGAGGSGLVWRVVHQRSGRRGALKGITRLHDRSGTPDRPPAPDWSVSREALALARLDHPHIAPVLDEGRVPPRPPADVPFVPGTPWFVMELAVGGSLIEHLDRFDWPRLQPTLTAVLRALAHAHAAGLLHRDVKPSNIVVAAGAFSPRAVRLVDFGLALARPGARIGTPAYMAPEQAAGRADAEGPWSDLFGLGATAWHLATGHPPFGGLSSTRLEWSLRVATPPTFTPRFPVPAGFERWLRDLLAPEPEDRPSCAAEALVTLAALESTPADSSDRPPVRARAHAAEDETGRAAHDARSLLTLNATTFHDEVARGAEHSVMPRRLLPLVGRRAEEARLASVRDEALARRAPRVVVITGPSGIGATRLVAHALSECAERVPQVIARTHDVGDLPGFVAQLLGVPVTVSRARLVERMRHLGLSVWLADALGNVLSGLRPEGTEALLVQIVGALAKRRLVVLALDGRPPPEVLSLAARAAAGDRALQVALLVLVASADEAVVTRLARVGSEVMQLGPLDRVAQGVLLRSMLGLEPTLASLVEARAAGHPGYLVALLARWIEEGRLVESAEGWSLAGGLPELPPDPAQATRSMLAVWSPAERRALALAALTEAPLTLARWGRVVRDQPLLALAERAIGLGLMIPRGEGILSLASPILRDALRAEVDDLVAGHRAWIDALVAEGTQAEPVALALHLVAIDAPEAAERLIAAARRRFELDALADAVRLGEMALARLAADPADPARIDAELIVAEARWHLGDQAVRPAVEHLAAAAIGAQRRRALRLLAIIVRTLGELERAQALYETLIAESDDPLERARARLSRVNVMCWLGRLDEAEHDLAAVTPRLQEPAERLGVLRAVSVLARVRGDHARQLAAAREALVLSERLGSLHAMAAAATDIAGASIELGLRDEAFEMLTRSRQIGVGIGVADLALDELNLAWFHLRFEEDAAAEPHLDEAMRALERLGWQPPLAAANALAGWLAARRGDWTRADTCFAITQTIVDAVALRDPMIATALARAAVCASACGELVRARQLAARAATQRGNEGPAP